MRKSRSETVSTSPVALLRMAGWDAQAASASPCPACEAAEEAPAPAPGFESMAVKASTWGSPPPESAAAAMGSSSVSAAKSSREEKSFLIFQQSFLLTGFREAAAAAFCTVAADRECLHIAAVWIMIGRYNGRGKNDAPTERVVMCRTNCIPWNIYVRST